MFIAEFQCNARITFFQVKNDFCGIHINADCHAGNKMGDIFLLNEIIVFDDQHIIDNRRNISYLLGQLKKDPNFPAWWEAHKAEWEQ